MTRNLTDRLVEIKDASTQKSEHRRTASPADSDFRVDFGLRYCPDLESNGRNG